MSSIFLRNCSSKGLIPLYHKKYLLTGRPIVMQAIRLENSTAVSLPKNNLLQIKWQFVSGTQNSRPITAGTWLGYSGKLMVPMFSNEILFLWCKLVTEQTTDHLMASNYKCVARFLGVRNIRVDGNRRLGRLWRGLSDTWIDFRSL